VIEAVNVSAEVVAAILGVSVTVVAIIVQLAATRYNHHITQIFIREPLNVAVQAVLVSTTLLCIWIAALGEQELASWMNIATLVMVSVALLLLLPYFAYVFTFISPLNIIRRIRRDAEKGINVNRRADTQRAIEQLQDVARSAIDQGDRAIAMACVNALADLFIYYREARPSLPEHWFHLDQALRQDPDFIALETNALEELDASRLWVEVKIYEQFVSILRLSVLQMPNVAGQIGISCRQIALAHLREVDVLDVTWRCFNSSLRLSLNARDARTTYYLLSQYKTVAEALIGQDNEEQALAAADYIQTYGQLAFTMDQPFILEVGAFDLGELLRVAKTKNSGILDDLLSAYLELDHEIKSESQEASLLGVRRAQMQLGAFFLSCGDVPRAQRVADDLKTERSDRLFRLRNAMLSDDRELFWEFTPRGVNFGYLAPEYRPHLDTLMDMVFQSP
jgi:hypothetical protein